MAMDRTTKEPFMTVDRTAKEPFMLARESSAATALHSSSASTRPSPLVSRLRNAPSASGKGYGKRHGYGYNRVQG